MKQKLVFFAEVKHSVRYKNAKVAGDDELVESIYLLKAGLKKPYPVVVEMTIEEVK